MKNDCCKIILNAVSRAELDHIVGALLKERLIACADTMPMDSRYWWKGKVGKEGGFIEWCYSTLKKKRQIIARVQALHSDECPGIVFVPIQANTDFLQWIKASCNM